jgi:hypothetical protein
MSEYIQAVLTFTIPMSKLTEKERREWRKQFEQLQHELQQTCPDGCRTTLVVSIVQEQ